MALATSFFGQNAERQTIVLYKFSTKYSQMLNVVKWSNKIATFTHKMKETLSYHDQKYCQVRKAKKPHLYIKHIPIMRHCAYK